MRRWSREIGTFISKFTIFPNATVRYLNYLNISQSTENFTQYLTSDLLLTYKINVTYDSRILTYFFRNLAHGLKVARVRSRSSSNAVRPGKPACFSFSCSRNLHFECNFLKCVGRISTYANFGCQDKVEVLKNQYPEKGYSRIKSLEGR